jgi:hypothetical protein
MFLQFPGIDGWWLGTTIIVMAKQSEKQNREQHE